MNGAVSEGRIVPGVGAGHLRQFENILIDGLTIDPVPMKHDEDQVATTQLEPMALSYAPRPQGEMEQLGNSIPAERRKGIVKWWAVATLLIFLVMMLVAWPPLIVACFFWGKDPAKWSDIAKSFSEPWFWLIIGAILGSQAFLLVVPVRAVGAYEMKRRHVMLPISVAFLFLTLLVGGAVLSLILLVFTGNVHPLVWVAGGSILLGSWVWWGFRFRKYAQSSPDGLMSGVRSTMYKGSVLELLVAISCHMWVRWRGDCSAPAYTFAAICTGVATMMMAFGPGIFILLGHRARRMKPEKCR